MFNMMYYRDPSVRTEWQRQAILETNEYYLKWHRANLSSASGATNGNFSFAGPAPPPGMPPGLSMPICPQYPPPVAGYNVPDRSSMPPLNIQTELPNAEFNQDNAHAESGQPSHRAYLSSASGATNGNFSMPMCPQYPPPVAGYNVPDRSSMPPLNIQTELPNAEFNQDNAHAESGQPSHRAYLSSASGATNGNFSMPMCPQYPPPVAGYNVPDRSSMPPLNIQTELPNAEFNQDNAHAESGQPSHRAYLSSASGATNGNFPFAGPAPPPGMPPGLLMPMYLQYPPPVAGYNVPARLSSMPPLNIQTELPNAKFNQDNAHAESGQPSNFTHLHNHNQPHLQNGIMLPDPQYYPRTLPLPEESFCDYLPVFQPGYQEPMPMYDNAYNVIDGRELPPGTIPDFRVDPNYVLVNREQRRLEQTWAPNVNETFFEGVTDVMALLTSNTEYIFGTGDCSTVGVDWLATERVNNDNSRADEELEEELEALRRWIDIEFKSAE